MPPSAVSLRAWSASGPDSSSIWSATARSRVRWSACGVSLIGRAVICRDLIDPDITRLYLGLTGYSPHMPSARPTAEHFDVIIVGARCAGSPLATLLARTGIKVCVVDR